jgi:hypothetical protein
VNLIIKVVLTGSFLLLYRNKYEEELKKEMKAKTKQKKE